MFELPPMTLFGVPCRLTTEAPEHEILIHPFLLGEILDKYPVEEVRNVLKISTPSS